MKIKLNVADAREAEAIRRGLEDRRVRAFVKIMGALLPLGIEERSRILKIVHDHLNDPANQRGN